MRQLTARYTVRHAAIAVMLVALWGGAAAAQEGSATSFGLRDTDVRKLGGSTRFNKPMRTIEDLRAMASANRAQLARVLTMTGLSNIAEPVINALLTGTMTDTSVMPGTRMVWMALKRSGTADVLRNVKWSGRQPFDAWQFSVIGDGFSYTFVVPKICGNISLVSATAVPAAVVTEAPRPEPPPPPPAPPVIVEAPPLPPPPPAPQVPAPIAVASNPTDRWLASAFVGAPFGTDVADVRMGDDGVTYGAQVGYLWHRHVGGEFIADFASKIDFAGNFANLAFEDDPRVGAYMLNVIGAMPFASDDRYQPYVSGGFGVMSMHTSVFTRPLLSNEVATATENRFGTNIGAGIVAFAGHVGLRGDIRYFKAPSASEDSATVPQNLTGVLSGQSLTKGLLSGLQFWRGTLGVSFRW